MKTLNYEFKQLKEKREGLQFVHNYFISYLPKTAIKKFEKMLKECGDKQEELLERARTEYKVKIPHH